MSKEPSKAMSVNPLDDTDAETETATEQTQRLATLETGEGVVIYDRENHRAWIQSDSPELVTDRQ